MANMFKANPLYLDKARSLMVNNYRHVTGINHGRIYPIDHFRVQPGDTIIQNVNAIIRGATPLAQVMSNSHLELYAFFVPDYIIWTHAKQFFGENDTNAWTQTIGYKKPKAIWTTCKGAPAVSSSEPTSNDIFYLKASDNKFYSVPLGEDCFFNKNKIASYLGINPGFTASDLKRSYDNNKYGPAIATNCMAIRSYWQIWNDYFRDENYVSPIIFNKGDADFNVCDQTLPYGISTVSSITAKPGAYQENGSNILFAFKKQDSFTTVLPEPTKGPQINLLALGQEAPVYTGLEHPYPTGKTQPERYYYSTANTHPGRGSLETDTNGYLAKNDLDLTGATTGGQLKPSNLWADLTAAGSLTIEAIRLAAATTQYYEALARGGSRFNEAIRSLFGVTPSDNSIQRAEYLGGNQVAITQYQVAQTAPNTSGADLGKIGAFSYTNHTTNLIRKSFDVWGTVMIVAVARVEHEYSNAIDPDDITEDILDEYFPQFDGIGDQPIDKQVLNVATKAFYYGNPSDRIYNPSSDTWGFQEAWWYKRFRHSRCSGVMNPTNPNALTYWTYAEPYFDPYMSTNVNWLLAIEDEKIVDRTLQLGAFASALAQQLICNFEFKQAKYTVMRARSIPGLTRI